MAQPVAVLEVNPADPSEVEVSYVPLDDLDDFLEDVLEDYELGFGELGAISKKHKATVKLHGSVKVKHKGGGFFKKLGRGLKRAGKFAVTGGMSEVARLAKLRGKLKAAGKGGLRVAASLRGRAHVARRIAGKVTKVMRVAKGRSTHVPLNRKALVAKSKAKRMAHNIAALGGSSKMRPAAKHAVAAAIKGLPLRPKKLRKTAKHAIKHLRAENIRCCVIAHKRDGAGAGGQLHSRYRERRHVNTCRPMLPKKFDATFRVLLGKIEDRNTSPDIQVKIDRLKKLSGIKNFA